MKYYAHKTEDNRTQPLRVHLENTADLAAKNSIDNLKELAHAAGKAHDLGKYSRDFQLRLDGKNIKFEHSVCGAIEYSESPYSQSKKTALAAWMLEYCIAGHHTGLPDGGSLSDSEITLQGRLKHKDTYSGNSDYSAYKEEIELEFPDCLWLTSEILSRQDSAIEKFAFFTRYLFSCLTDADYLDTEQFCCSGTNRLLNADFEAVKSAVDRKLDSFKPVTELQMARGRIQKQAYENAVKSGNISILNIPTGSGKTLCSLKIALEKLLRPDSTKKRIIYVIPYTSIIEQTADVFTEIFGEYTEILQHHSNYCFEDASEVSTADKLKKASENWDAPFIITTSVRFFETLYHYKGSSLRKLHNLADSVIIFDEIHLLPIKYLQPCLRGIGCITKYLNSDAIFLSATMPDYGDLFERYLPDCTYSELVNDKSDFRHFKKCRFSYLGRTGFDNIIEKSQNYTNRLIVVNKRKSARDIYKKISGKKYHLSTYMTPIDRSKTIAGIRADLAGGERITVVSTSLIEAGVDLDFKAVFREIAGLDNIIQAGGRCNREGLEKHGDVFVFETDEGIIRDLQTPSDIVKDLFANYDDITSVECIEEYYRRLFNENEDLIKKSTIDDGRIRFLNIPFRTYAQKFEFISEESVGVVIANYSEAEELYNCLKYGDYSVKRKLQKYTVSLKRYELENAIKLGVIDDFGTGVFYLTNKNYYNSETGLDLDFFNDMII